MRVLGKWGWNLPGQNHPFLVEKPLTFLPARTNKFRPFLIPAYAASSSAYGDSPLRSMPASRPPERNQKPCNGFQ